MIKIKIKYNMKYNKSAQVSIYSTFVNYQRIASLDDAVLFILYVKRRNS